MGKKSLVLILLLFSFACREEKFEPIPEPKIGNNIKEETGTYQSLKEKKLALEERKVSLSERKFKFGTKPKIRLKKEKKGAYSWEITGSDLGEILKINQRLKKEFLSEEKGEGE